MQSVKIEIRAVLSDQGGKIIKRYPWKRANSLLKQFILFLHLFMGQVAQTIKDTGGTDRAVGGYTGNLGVNAAAANTLFGIVIGTGETPVTMTDNKLQTQVTTNVAHAVTTVATESPDTSTWRIAVSRSLTNNTGATLSVKEAGLYAIATASAWYFCIDRTLYAVDVPSGLVLTLTYRITISL